MRHRQGYQSEVKIKSKEAIIIRGNFPTSMGNCMPYGISRRYLQSGSGDCFAFTPAEAYTRSNDPVEMQGSVDLGQRYIPR